MYWRQCGICDRPFRWWLLAHSILQLLQVPIRVVFLMRLEEAERLGTSAAECVASVTASPAWRASKTVSFITYAWFVLGVVWVMNAGQCDACPGIYKLMLAVIVQAADPADIKALPVLTYSDALFQ